MLYKIIKYNIHFGQIFLQIDGFVKLYLLICRIIFTFYLTLTIYVLVNTYIAVAGNISFRARRIYENSFNAVFVVKKHLKLKQKT